MLWRRLDAAFADPLELDAASRLGTPGLVEAVRAGSVTLVNALGSGILETRALLAFMPRIAARCWASRWSCPTSPPGGAARRPSAPTSAPTATG